VVHVIDVEGTDPSLNIWIESAPDNTFATPTTRGSALNVTTIGSIVIDIHGPITDTWWRAAWNVNGTAAVFEVAIVVGKPNH
jgi:hypothetical protein